MSDKNQTEPKKLTDGDDVVLEVNGSIFNSAVLNKVNSTNITINGREFVQEQLLLLSFYQGRNDTFTKRTKIIFKYAERGWNNFWNPTKQLWERVTSKTGQSVYEAVDFISAIPLPNPFDQ